VPCVDSTTWLPIADQKEGCSPLFHPGRVIWKSKLGLSGEEGRPHCSLETQKASALPNPPVNGKKDGQRSTAAHREGYMQSEGADRTFSFSCSHHLSCAKLHLCDKTWEKVEWHGVKWSDSTKNCCSEVLALEKQHIVFLLASAWAFPRQSAWSCLEFELMAKAAHTRHLTFPLGDAQGALVGTDRILLYLLFFNLPFIFNWQIMIICMNVVVCHMCTLQNDQIRLINIPTLKSVVCVHTQWDTTYSLKSRKFCYLWYYAKWNKPGTETNTFWFRLHVESKRVKLIEIENRMVVTNSQTEGGG
jgi:hypothetical protein